MNLSDITSYISEAESERQEYIGMQDEYTYNPEQFKPGSCGMHEALDRVGLIKNQIEYNLLNHPAIIMNPEWFTKAWVAFSLLYDLEYEIGVVHMECE